eukprot:365313-Chlamydomonas_euryale.AAC.42
MASKGARLTWWWCRQSATTGGYPVRAQQRVGTQSVHNIRWGPSRCCTAICPPVPPAACLMSAAQLPLPRRAGNVGFVADPRRLNVAITRPRRGLVVICSPRTLDAGSNDWHEYLGWANEQVRGFADVACPFNSSLAIRAPPIASLSLLRASLP